MTMPVQPELGASELPAPPSLVARVVRAGGMSLVGTIGSQGLRFISNLVLTRLLFPEAFGLMAITQSILMAARLLSDVGLQQSIMRSERGHEPVFFNSVWTLNIVKDASLTLIMCMGAPFVARFYHQPMLSALVPAMAFSMFLSAFNSSKLALVNRRLEVGRLVSIELAAQVSGIVTMIAWALVDRSPWALVAGNWVTSIVTLLASHFALKGPANRWAWDRVVIAEVLSFGGWVMLSSIVTFLLGEGSNLLNGWLVGAKAVGFLNLSNNLVLVAWSAIQTISGRVLFPAYAEVWRERPQDLSRVLERSRNLQLLAACTVAVGFVVLGQQVIDFFYDHRYHAVGALLQIQAVGTIFAFASSSYASVLWAIGRGGLNAVIVGAQAVFLMILLVIGSHFGGVLGLMTASAFIGLAIYPVNAWIFNRFDLLHPRTDMAVFSLGAVAAVYVYYLGAWRSAIF